MRFIFFFFFMLTFAFARNIHDWQSITNMNDVLDIASESEHVWAATSGGIYYYNAQTGGIKKYTNTDGLRSIYMSAIALDNQDNVICGGREGVLNILDKKTNSWTQLFQLEDLAIHDMIHNNDTLWVSAGKGLAVFFWDGDNYVFKDFFKNYPVLVNTTRYLNLFAGRIWVGSDQGLLSAPADLDEHTINDPAEWTLDNTSNGLPHNNVFDIQEIDNRLWIGTQEGLATIDSFLNIQTELNWGTGKFNSAYHIEQNNGKIYIASNYKENFIPYYYYYRYDPQTGKEFVRQFSASINTLHSGAELLFIAPGNSGLYRHGYPYPLRLDGPGDNTIRYIIKDRKAKIWASSGNNLTVPNLGYYVYNNDHWDNIDFYGSRWSDLGNSDVIYEDRFGNIWIGSWGGGVMVFNAPGDTLYFHNYLTDGGMTVTQGYLFTVISQTDAPRYHNYFSGTSNYPTYEIITDIKEDDYGRLWFANYWAGNDHLLAVAQYDGEFINLDKNKWAYFGRSDGIVAVEGGIMCIEFDDFGRVWIGTKQDGVYVLDYNNTLYDKSDDVLYHIVVNDNLYSNSINSIASDKDGIMWIGTLAGLNSYDGVNIYKHVGDENGNSGPLENRINFIFVDDFNNRWFATSGGLSVLRAGKSPWDTQAWEGFTTENSGLVSNNVHGLYVDSKTSEAVIGTDEGISVYSGTFAQLREDYNLSSGGPNPFIVEGTQKQFTITYLKMNSIVKIFTLNGLLVRELNADNGTVDGSRAFWDGRDSAGNFVSSGIYLYTGYDPEGNSTAGKIAVIRK